jgi:hypothetical protein
MVKEKFLTILKEARPKKVPFDPKTWDPANPGNMVKPTYTQNRLWKADQAIKAGKEPVKRGRPSALENDTKKRDQKKAGKDSLSKYPDRESANGIRDIVLAARITDDDGDEKDKFVKVVRKKQNIDKLKQLKDEYKAELKKKYPPERYDIEVVAPEFDRNIGEFTSGAAAVDFDLDY